MKKWVIRNHRTTTYSPIVTLSLLSADVTTLKGKQRIAVFIKRGKFAAWSMKNLMQPVFDEPMDLTVKEFSSKLNSLLTKQSISDEAVETLALDIAANPVDEKTYLKVYELGFGNNKAAIFYLHEWLTHPDEYIRLAAISTLGNLQANSEFSRLKEIYESASPWQERAMALKAICDLSSPDALAFAKQVYADLQQQNLKADHELAWLKEILDLYFL